MRGVKWIHKVCSRSVSSNLVACGARRLHAVQNEKEDIVRKGVLPEESPSAENHGECTRGRRRRVYLYSVETNVSKWRNLSKKIFPPEEKYRANFA